MMTVRLLPHGKVHEKALAVRLDEGRAPRRRRSVTLSAQSVTLVLAPYMRAASCRRGGEAQVDCASPDFARVVCADDRAESVDHSNRVS